MEKVRRCFWAGVAVGALAALVVLGVGFSVLFVVVLPFVGPRFAARTDPLRAVEGQRAFDFELEDVNPASPTVGRRVRLAETLGDRGAVVNFMASWCPPCLEELPVLHKIEAEKAARIVFVAAWEGEGGGRDALVKLAKAEALTSPILFATEAEDEELRHHYPHETIPTTYLVGQDQVIRRVLRGAHSDSEFRREIDQAFGGK